MRSGPAPAPVTERRKANMNIEKLNEFLDKNVDDKKLAERDDYEDLKKGKKKKK